MWKTLSVETDAVVGTGEIMSQTVKKVVLRGTGHADDLSLFTDETQTLMGPPVMRDLLIEVRAVAVSVLDSQIRKGLLNVPKGSVLGFDAAGVVKAVGSGAHHFAVGDRVYYAGQIDRDGAYASHQLVDERIVGHMPKTLTFAEAASLPISSLSAWGGLFDKLKVHSDSAGTLLVVGASSGVGPMAIQMARALTDLSVIATVEDIDAAKWVRGFGADVISDHDENFLEKVRRRAPGGVDYVFSTHSKGLASALVPVMNPYGEFVAVDTTRTEDLGILKDKSLSWHWENVFARPVHGAIDMQRQRMVLDEVANLVDAKRLRPPLTALMTPVNAKVIRAAHRRVESPRHYGKLVVTRGDVPDEDLHPAGVEVLEVR